MKSLILLDRLKEEYTDLCKTHEIQLVQENRIKATMRKIDDFAVDVKLAVKGKACEDAETTDEINMGELVGDHKRVAFISGITGMGKSVIAKKIVYSWANEKMYKNFTLCLYFRCRELNFFKQESGNQGKIEMIHRFIKDRMPGCEIPTDGDRLLIVIDGLGELFDLKEDDSIIYEFLNKRRAFRKSSLIITGQPSLEDMFDSLRMDIGEYHIIDVKALSETDIKKYIEKFSKCNGEEQSSAIKELIKKNIDSSKEIGPMLGVPQILNSICCLVMLHLIEEVESKVEIFTCVLYSMLRHVYENVFVTQRAKVDLVFSKYKKSILLFCKLAFLLYKQKRIIFKRREMEGEFEEIFRETSEFEQLFVKNLFLEVPSELEDQLQFKYLAVMQFLAAIYICAGNHVQELDDESFDEVLEYACGLFGACMRNGSIIKVMFECIIEGNIEEKAKSFLVKVQDVLHSKGKSLKYIELVNYLPKDVNDKEFVQTLFGKLHMNENYLSKENQEKLIKIGKHLVDCGCEEVYVKTIFSNVGVNSLSVKGRGEMLKIARYFKYIQSLQVSGIPFTAEDMESMEETFMRCKEVHIKKCEFKCILKNVNENDGRETSQLELEQFQVTGCTQNEDCFNLIAKWAASSRKVTISKMTASTEIWVILLKELKEKKDAQALKLKTLIIQNCGSNQNGDFSKKV